MFSQSGLLLSLHSLMRRIFETPRPRIFHQADRTAVQRAVPCGVDIGSTCGPANMLSGIKKDTSVSLWLEYRIHLRSSKHVIRHQKRHQRFLVVGISNPPVVQRTCYPRVIQHQKRHQQFLVVSEYWIHQASPSKHSLPEPFRNPGTSNPTNLRQPAIWPAQDVQKSVNSKGMGVAMDVP